MDDNWDKYFLLALHLAAALSYGLLFFEVFPLIFRKIGFYWERIKNKHLVYMYSYPIERNAQICAVLVPFVMFVAHLLLFIFFQEIVVEYQLTIAIYVFVGIISCLPAAIYGTHREEVEMKEMEEMEGFIDQYYRQMHR